MKGKAQALFGLPFDSNLDGPGEGVALSCGLFA
jgi:hypothetical protein